MNGATPLNPLHALMMYFNVERAALQLPLLGLLGTGHNIAQRSSDFRPVDPLTSAAPCAVHTHSFVNQYFET